MKEEKTNNDVCLKHNTKVPPSRQHFISLHRQWTEYNLAG